MILSTEYHLPVLLPEVLNGLSVQKGAKYIDATLGGGGYAFEIVKLGGVVLGIDQDQEAIDYVREKLEDRSWRLEAEKNLFLDQGNFANLKKIAKKQGFTRVSGIIFDLGMSTYQLKHSNRGFSFSRDEPLDMRMDKKETVRAADIINNYSKERLYEIFTKFAEELHSGAIISAILRARSLKRILTTKELATIVVNALREDIGLKEFEKYKNSTLARIFQALRIVVNNEIENLRKGLEQAEELLLPKGRLIVLSYHSLEDRLVKSFFKSLKRKGKLEILTKKAIVPEKSEIMANPKSRSVRLRIAEEL